MSDLSVGAALQTGAMASALKQQEIGAQLIDRTLHKLNMTAGTPMHPRLDPQFEMQSTVLGAAYTGKGTGLDTFV